MRQQHKHYYCIRAFADGWKIEYLASSNNKWYQSEYPEFAKNLAYRVVPDENGWLPWYGGECQAEPDTMVEIWFYNCIARGRGKVSEYDWDSNQIIAYRILKEAKADPYAELKAAAKDPTKQIRCGKTGTWGDAGTAWTFERPVQDYEIRNKPKKMKLLAYVDITGGDLLWRREDYQMSEQWKRAPSEDKEIEVEE